VNNESNGRDGDGDVGRLSAAGGGVPAANDGALGIMKSPCALIALLLLSALVHRAPAPGLCSPWGVKGTNESHLDIAYDQGCRLEFGAYHFGSLELAANSYGIHTGTTYYDGLTAAYSEPFTVTIYARRIVVGANSKLVASFSGCVPRRHRIASRVASSFTSSPSPSPSFFRFQLQSQCWPGQ